MDHAAVMRRFERGGNLDGDRKSAADRERTTRENLLQGFAGHILHHEKVDAVLLNEVVNDDNVRVFERRSGPRLLEEAGTALRIGEDLGLQPLDGHGTAEHRILSPEDFAHPASADLSQQFVMTNGDGGRHKRA